jgi:hypothetical protein
MRIVALEEYFTTPRSSHDRSSGLQATTPVRVVIGIGVGDLVDPGIGDPNRGAARPHAVGCEKAPRVFLEMTVKRRGRVTVPTSNLEGKYYFGQRGRATDVQTIANASQHFQRGEALFHRCAIL